MEYEEIKLLLVKYITKEATVSEIQQVENWIEMNNENELYFIELYDAWQNMLYLRPDVMNEEKAYKLLLSKIAIPVPLHKKWMSRSKIAAILVGFLFLYGIGLRHNSINSTIYYELTSQNGKIKKVVLIDGTIVWLNSGSILKYSSDFGKSSRSVFLEGEAFFEIGPMKKGIPFLVQTKNYVIKDIGTKFNLKAYANDHYIETTVIKGEVSVQGNRYDHEQAVIKPIQVMPHQVLKIYFNPLLEVNQQNKVASIKVKKIIKEVQLLQVEPAKLTIYDGWKEDLLVFDGATLDEIARILERKYDVKITLNDSELKLIRYSGKFKNITSIEKVLDIIKENTPINYTAIGNALTITKNN